MSFRVGISGAGRISGFHARGFAAAGGDVVAVADPRLDAASTLASEYGADAFASLEEMLANAEIDVLSIATPHDIHEAQAIVALGMGVDVFMDKPLALTEAGGRTILAAARSSGRVLGVCHNLLFHPAVKAAKTFISEGRIGAPVSAEAWSAGWLDLSPTDFRLDKAKTGGGAWFDAAGHLLYTLDHLLGPFETLQAVAAVGRPSRLGGEDAAVAIARMGSGTVATMRVSYAHRAPDSDKNWPDGWRQGFEINGTDGAIRIEVTPRGVLKTYELSGDEWVRQDFEVDFAETFTGAIRDFVRARAGEHPVTTPEKSLEILGLITAAMS